MYCSICEKYFAPQWIENYPQNIAIRPNKLDTSLGSLEMKRFEDENPTPHKYNYMFK